MSRLTNKTALVTGGSSGIGSSKLEIRDAREAELPAMVNLTKASYAEFQDGSPSGFWDMYMTNIEEAIAGSRHRTHSGLFQWGVRGKRIALPQNV